MNHLKHSKKQQFTLIGKKLGMTQVFDANQKLVPVTVIQVGPCTVTQVKTVAIDGYTAIQLGFNEQKEHRLNEPILGHLKKAGATPVSKLQEFRVDSTENFNLGDVLTVTAFVEGQKVDITGNTIGHGFQGVVKRYGFSGGPASHGSMFHRRGGSYGMRQTPGHVYKGRKMPGHMGCKNRTTQNLKIEKIIVDKNLILVRGSFAGAEGSLITIRNSKKKGVVA